MSTVTPCRACIPTDLGGLGGEPNPLNLYSLEQPPFGVIYNCPAGYDCNSSPWIELHCCGNQVFLNLQGVTGADRLPLIQAAVAQCARFWQFCGDIPTFQEPHTPRSGGGNPPQGPVNLYWNSPACCPVPCPFGTATPVSYCVAAGSVAAPTQAQANSIAQTIACTRARLGIRLIGNNEKSYTASCPLGDPTPPVTRVVPANTYGECLFNASPAEINNAQIFYDNIAQIAAQNEAEAALPGCFVCSASVHGFASCPGDPGKIASITLPAGAVCMPNGTPQNQVDAAAQTQLYNALQASLATQGCACTSSIAGVVLTSPCNIQIQMYCGCTPFGLCPAPLNGIINITGGVPFDWAAAYQLAIGNPLPPGCYAIHPVSYTAPDTMIYH